MNTSSYLTVWDATELLLLEMNLFFMNTLLLWTVNAFFVYVDNYNLFNLNDFFVLSPVIYVIVWISKEKNRSKEHRNECLYLTIIESVTLFNSLFTVNRNHHKLVLIHFEWPRDMTWLWKRKFNWFEITIMDMVFLFENYLLNIIVLWDPSQTFSSERKNI